VGPDYPYVCEVGDPAGLVKAVLEVASLPKLEREALGHRLRARAQDQFSPHHVARMLEELL
jgi:glycosyltransferase involved in cell wall biosynthesis